MAGLTVNTNWLLDIGEIFTLLHPLPQICKSVIGGMNEAWFVVFE